MKPVHFETIGGIRNLSLLPGSFGQRPWGLPITTLGRTDLAARDRGSPTDGQGARRAPGSRLPTAE